MCTSTLALVLLLGLAGPGPHRAARSSEPAAEHADADADGVVDLWDACPGTPRGFPVDGNGCASDADADGVPDALDRCPGTAQDAPGIDEHGCSIQDRKTERAFRYAVKVT